MQRWTEDKDMKRCADEAKLLQEEAKDSYGRYLERHGRLKEASILFCGAKNWTKAIDLYIRSGGWELAIGLAKKLNYSCEELDRLHKSVLSTLEDLQVSAITF